MTLDYRIELNFRPGIPQTVLVGGMKPLGIAMHWTAGGTGRAGALGTVQFFIDAAYRNASYHVLVWWERPVFGVMWIVPPDRASHSMNPAPPDWSPNAEVRRILGAKWADPNAASLAVSFCGMPADLEAALQDADFLEGYERLTRELLAIPSLSTRPLMNHGWGQPVTRYDAGDALIPAIYARLEPVPEPDMPFIEKYEEWTGAAGTPFWTDGPGVGPQKALGPTPTPLTTVAQSVDNNWRIARYQNAPGAPRELLYFRRKPGLTPKVPGGDAAFDAAVVAALERRTPVPDCSAQDAKLTEARLAVTALRTQHTEEGAALEGVARVLG